MGGDWLHGLAGVPIVTAPRDGGGIGLGGWEDGHAALCPSYEGETDQRMSDGQSPCEVGGDWLQGLAGVPIVTAPRDGGGIGLGGWEDGHAALCPSYGGGTDQRM
ncbi:hypothetical protein CKO23_10350 [Thiocystis violacea]|nr:hypothetical protein [Thiocystis violacea]